MLYVFFGKDQSKVRGKALAHMQTLSTEGSEMVKITEDGYYSGIVHDLAQSVSLFGGEQVILVDTPSSDVVFSEAVQDSLAEMQASQNHFVVIEAGLLAAAKKLYTAHAEYIEELASPTKETFNTFSLTDAFLNRDKKTLWLLLIEAWKAGETNEAIVGILYWQIKILRLAERTQGAEEAGQKPFVYNKAKRALVKFKKGDLDRLSRQLLKLYHDGHKGKVDMSVALERWVLSI